MITAPGWQEPVYTDEQLDAIERKRYVTMMEFSAILRRAIKRSSPEEKADLRRTILLWNLPLPTDLIQ